MEEAVFGKEIRRLTTAHLAEYRQLHRVTILNPMLMLPEGIFADHPHVIIRAHGGSFAEFYAKKHGHPFEEL